MLSGRSETLGPSTTLDLCTHYQCELDPRVGELFAEFCRVSMTMPSQMMMRAGTRMPADLRC